MVQRLNISRRIDINDDGRTDALVRLQRDRPDMTKAVQDPNTGLLHGRKDLPGHKGDGTSTFRIRSVVLKKNSGLSASDKKDLANLRPGQIRGRSPKVVRVRGHTVNRRGQRFGRRDHQRRIR